MADFSKVTAKLLPLPSGVTYPNNNCSNFLNLPCVPINEMQAQNQSTADIGFIYMSYVLCLPGLKLVATSNGPLTLSPIEIQNPMLVLPPYEACSAESTAFWFPKGLPEKDLDVQGKVLVILDVGRLRSTISAMSSTDFSDSNHTLLNTPGSILLSGNGIDFGAAFRGLYQMIDAYACDKSLLTNINFDDLVYRQVLMLLLHDSDKKQFSKAGRSFRSCLVDDLCARLNARLHMPLSLADIEALSGISIRSLQYAFQERFNCSPMAWLREQRLIKARSELQQDSSPIMEIAVRCGFGSVSLFCRQYRSRFGETPSATRKKAE